MGIAALILGIASIVLSWYSAWIWPGIVGLILGVVGLILAILAKKQGQGGVATAGLICSIIGLALSIILLIACVACYACVGTGALVNSLY